MPLDFLHIDAASMGGRNANDVLLASIRIERADAEHTPDGKAICGDANAAFSATFSYAAQVEIDNVCPDCREIAVPQGAALHSNHWSWLPVDVPYEVLIYTPPGYPR